MSASAWSAPRCAAANAAGNLGHVFPDGPPEQGGLRYCIQLRCAEFLPRPTTDRALLSRGLPRGAHLHPWLQLAYAKTQAAPGSLGAGTDRSSGDVQKEVTGCRTRVHAATVGAAAKRAEKPAARGQAGSGSSGWAQAALAHGAVAEARRVVGRRACLVCLWWCSASRWPWRRVRSPGYSTLKATQPGQTIVVRARDGREIVELGPSFGEWLDLRRNPRQHEKRDDRGRGQALSFPFRVRSGASDRRGGGRRDRIARAAGRHLDDHPAAGAQTCFSIPNRTFDRKAREAVLAMALEWKFSKEEILELYLNKVYFGGGAYGIDSASRKNSSATLRPN